MQQSPTTSTAAACASAGASVARAGARRLRLTKPREDVQNRGKGKDLPAEEERCYGQQQQGHERHLPSRQACDGRDLDGSPLHAKCRR